LFALNLTANQRLIRAFETPLRRAPAGRALFVTAPQARKPEAYWGPYAATKAALECLVKCWAAETARTQLRVNLLDPGAIETGLRAQAFPGEPKGAVPGPDQLAPVFRELLGPECRRHGQLVGAF
jgi:NAD(P)-dependent dehydrogenase (short-subunit alcohol dehydrogenase family)